MDIPKSILQGEGERRVSSPNVGILGGMLSIWLGSLGWVRL